MTRKLLLILVILALIVLVPLLKGRFGEGNVKEVETESLQVRGIQTSVLASGTLAHEEEVLLSTEEIGKVTAIHVKEGDRVTKGQLLLQIDDEVFQAAVEQNRASVRMQEIAIERQQLRVENLQKQWERKQTIFERKLLDEDAFEIATNELEIAKSDLESSRESLQQSQAQLEQAENRLSKTKAFSPINGVVTSLDIKVGETAISSTTNIPGSSLMTIANPESIHTEVNIDEADIANIQVGQEAMVYAIAHQDQPIKGKVNIIAISAKKAEGAQGLSFLVKIGFTETPPIKLRPGMSCRAEIFTATKEEVPAVPVQAILVDEDRTKNNTSYFVFVDKAGKAVKTEVKVGISDDAYQQIKSGVATGDSIIIGPDSVLQQLKDGDKVKTKAD